MSTRPSIAALALLLAFLTTLSAAAAEPRKVYKWLDSQGNIHYSDRLPSDPEATQRQLLNPSGITVQELDRPSESVETVVQRRELLRSGNRDTALMTTFENEQALRQSQDESLSLLRNSISISRNNAVRLQAQLDQLEGQHQGMIAAGTAVPPREKQTVERIRSTLEEQQDELEKLHHRYKVLETSHAQELARYRQLSEQSTANNREPL